MSEPEISLTVVMPVYNAIPFLEIAIKSIVEQTFSEFRLVIYDDHSTDGSYELALEWQARDARILVVRGEHRLGPQRSSQQAADLATSEYVARMDADDVSHPERLASQIATLRGHKEASLVGSLADLIDAQGRIIRRSSPRMIAQKSAPFAHASIMYRRAAFVAAGGYQPGTDYFEDADLYRRMAMQGQLLIVNRALVNIRFAAQNARWRDSRIDTLRQIDRRHRAEHPEDAVADKFGPEAFLSIAMLGVFAGKRPGLLIAMLRHCSFRPLGDSVKILLYIMFATLSPAAARGLAFIRAKALDTVYPQPYEHGGTYVWRPPAQG